MDAQDDSISKPSPEFRMDMSAIEIVTVQASQDMSSKDMEIDQAYQACHKTTKEVHKERSSEGMATDKASQAGCRTTKKVHENGSSKGMAANKAFQDGPNTARAFQDGPDTAGVKPEMVVNADFRSWFDAVLEGDWKEIEKILKENSTAMITKVMKIEDKPESDHLTMLDVAIITAQDQLVEKLVNHLPPKFERFNRSRALCYAARGGRMRMVKALVDKIDPEPAIIHETLRVAAVYAPPDQKELMWYLARRLLYTPKIDIMMRLIILGHTDIALYLARKFPVSWTFKDFEDMVFLKLFGAMTPNFRSGDRLNFWENCVYKFIPLCLVDTLSDDSKKTKMAQAQVALNRIKILLWNLATIPAPFIKRIEESKFRHDCSLCLANLAFTGMKDNIDAIKILEYLSTSRLVLDAASRGAYEIVDLCFRYFPELLWNINFTRELLKEIVGGRHVELFRLVKARTTHIRCLDDSVDMKGFIRIDVVTKWSSRCVSRDVSGAAFLLQRELQWFQVLSPPARAGFSVKYQLNRQSYWEDFVEQRNDLLKEAEQWMKDTSSSCSVVATLIITIAFAAAFTVPGGNNGNTGIPIFLKNGSFMVFAVADALALFYSITATMMFLTILTSRYAIEDFLRSLPSKMILGLTFLFLSLAFMLVAFASTLVIFLNERWKWSYIPITLLAACPIVLFIILQLPLYIEMVESTYRPRLYRPLRLRK